MSRSLSTIVFYGYTFTAEEAGLIDQAQSYTVVGKGNTLEWRSFGALEYEGCGMALAVAASLTEKYGCTPVSITTDSVAPGMPFPFIWDDVLSDYLRSISVTPPNNGVCQWWAVSSYG